MNVMIYGFNAIGILLGGLLSLKGQKVSFIDPVKQENKVTSVRIIMPNGWIKVDNLKYGIPNSVDFLFICCDIQDELPDKIKAAINPETNVVILHTVNSQWNAQTNSRVTYAIPLAPCSMLQEDQIEVFTTHPVFVFEKNARLKKFLNLLRHFGIQCKFVDAITPYYNAYILSALLHLPVALANTSLDNFLSFPEGQKIVENILVEGFKIYEQCEKKLVALPLTDPRVILNTLQKKPWQFSINRFLPGRNYNPLLQALLLKQQTGKIFNRDLLALADEVGIELFWNAKVVSLFEHIQETGLFKNPVELLKAIE